jgi:hypothetical protein
MSAALVALHHSDFPNIYYRPCNHRLWQKYCRSSGNGWAEDRLNRNPGRPIAALPATVKEKSRISMKYGSKIQLRYGIAEKT